MVEDMVSAVIAQLRKVLELMKQGAPVTEENKLEFETAEVMLKNMMANRGRFPMTAAQALELAIVINETHDFRKEQGIEVPPFEETMAEAEKLLRMPKPTEN